jgi:hypothetical protein
MVPADRRQRTGESAACRDHESRADQSQTLSEVVI